MRLRAFCWVRFLWSLTFDMVSELAIPCWLVWYPTLSLRVAQAQDGVTRVRW
jgi:hypothetical protein